MENYRIDIEVNNEVHHFEVGEYLHHDGESCKFKVFEGGMMVASFDPDSHQYLHICQNPGKLDEGLLYRLAERIEAHHPIGINDNKKHLL